MHSPQSCASCGNLDCSMSYASKKKQDGDAITAYLLDDVWPEYAAYIQREYKKGDKIITLGIGGYSCFHRYQWPLPVTHVGTIRTLARHWAMRRVADRHGAERQACYLYHDQMIAHILARHIDYRAQHLVIYQNYLPYLARLGMLGGRSYDVLMTRYPLKRLHNRLDEVAQHLPDCASIRDFRANNILVEDEWQALSHARRIVTPHHGIATLFPNSVHLLNWEQPAKREHRKGDRVAFLGPVIARQGAYIIRDLARRLRKPLIVFGENLEADNFWEDIPIERRMMNANWLYEVAVLIQPCVAINQPRKLLEALANGVQVFTNEGAGLPFDHYQPIEQFIAIKNQEEYLVFP